MSISHLALGTLEPFSLLIITPSTPPPPLLGSMLKELKVYKETIESNSEHKKWHVFYCKFN